MLVVCFGEFFKRKRRSLAGAGFPAFKAKQARLAWLAKTDMLMRRTALPSRAKALAGSFARLVDSPAPLVETPAPATAATPTFVPWSASKKSSG
jgi:hypothetical protein